ncbi:MAG: tail-specific protease [Verrucomicrobia bacterium]|nr:tail-specific protease [Verrucomicrobiota bacterium]
MRISLFLLALNLTVVLYLRADEAGKALTESQPLTFAATNNQVILDVRAKKTKPLEPGRNDANIARYTALLLEHKHFLQQPFNDSISSKFLDRYLETLDYMHMHFLQSDLDDFESYRTILDELVEKRGDLTPAHHMFSVFLRRLEQRVAYVGELLTTEKFEFKGNDRYSYDRRKSAPPKSLDEAKELWRQHLRYEILQEKLNKEKPEEIGAKISRRYARLLRMFKEYDSDDVIELYLSSLARVYDPHSDYMGKSQFENFNVSMSLKLYGIGALLQSEDGYCRIKSLVPNGPAAKSKQIKENDRIIAVAQGDDNEPVDVVEMKLNKVVEMIRGVKGTKVRLTIIPADAPDPSVRKTVALIRDEIKLEDQEAKAKLIELPGEKTLRLGVIDLPSFYAEFELGGKKTDGQPKSTTVDVRKLITKLNHEKVDGIILDLRRNGGGSLEEAINLTGLFIKEGPVVQVKDHDGKQMVERDTDPSVVYDGPLIVLTSRHSASASEILAGALQDYGRALIVGDDSTHGKGTVQALDQLDKYIRQSGLPPSNPGALKVTIRKFYRASGSSTQLKGVTPDIILPSLNNYGEVGEAALDNPLPWDAIPSAKYEKLNRIQPFLAELQKRSAKRVTEDKDFSYLREDIEQYKKTLADKSVSLNEAQRLKEKQEAETRFKTRQDELKTRPSLDEKVYEITLKLADLPGLPPPVEKSNTVAKAESPKPIDADSDSAEDSTESKALAIDIRMKEAKRILADMISLSGNGAAVASANTKTELDTKAGGNLTTGAKP